MKHVAIAALLLLAPLQVSALTTDELLGVIAMPLAVAAVSEVTGVPAADLSSLVANLNRAEVPPAQFVQVIRYAPAALVVQDQNPTFAQYVEQQVSSGVVGTELVTSIDQRLRTYEVTPEFVTITEPAPTYVLADDYIPPMVITRVTTLRPVSSQPVIGDANDLLALIAMPLAVNAVSRLTGVPMSDLGALVASLNQANVAPVQVIEVLRYAPVALVVDDGQPQFVQFVQTQVNDGVTGPRLFDVVVNRLRTYDVTPQLAPRPSTSVVYVDDNFIPPVVTTRIAERRAHPHGGPPGQLKKELGLQTGAEVVHGTKPGKQSREIRTVDTREARVAKARKQKVEHVRVVQQPPAARVIVPVANQGRGKPEKADKPGKDRGHGNAPGADHGQGGGNGKGKGKGKG